jgi:hypothetical protein
MLVHTNQIFDGILVAAAWDRLNRIRKVSLYTLDGEDILLEHKYGIEKFRPLINQRVRVRGEVVSDDREERKILVRRIHRLGKEYFKRSPSVEFEEYSVSDLVAFSA